MISPRIRIATLILSTSLLAACASGPTPPVHLYQLSAQAQVMPDRSLPKSVGIGPLVWPDYLNRRQLIVRLDAGRLDTLDNERWAEPLDINFSRTLRENLVRTLHPQRLQSHPWSLTDVPEVNVPLEILQFDTDTQGNTVLRARWRVTGRDHREIAAERDTEIRLKARDTTPSSIVTSQSEALAKLAEAISQTLAQPIR